eukprot:UN11447
MMEEGPKLFDCEAISLFLHDPIEESLWTKVADKSSDIEVQLKNGGISAYVFTTKQATKAGVDPHNNKNPKKFQTRNILTRPIKIDDRIYGVIEVVNKKGTEPFSRRG